MNESLETNIKALFLCYITELYLSKCSKTTKTIVVKFLSFKGKQQTKLVATNVRPRFAKADVRKRSQYDAGIYHGDILTYVLTNTLIAVDGNTIEENDARLRMLTMMLEQVAW